MGRFPLEALSGSLLASLLVFPVTSRRLARGASGLLSGWLPPLATTFGFNACPQGIHKVHDIRSRRLFRLLDLFALGLLFNQFAKGVFVLILEFFGLDAGLGVDDVQGEIEHVFRHLSRFRRNILPVSVLRKGSVASYRACRSSRASRAMMCSREVKTTLPTATMPSLRIASRITAKACWPTSPSGAM